MIEREEKILEACRHIGDTVYYTIFNVPDEEPRLMSQTVCCVEIHNNCIDFTDEFGGFICLVEDIGKWKGDVFHSFSSSEVEEKIEEWWKKNLNL